VAIASETIFQFANEVARAMRVKHPGKRIGVFAYSGYAHPPSFRLEPEVYVELTAGFRRTPLSLDEQLAQFAKKAGGLGIYEYFDVEQWSWDQPGRARAAQLDALQKTLRFYHERNVKALSGEMSNNFGPNGIGYYAITRLLWHADTNVREVEAAFYRDAFGPAADAVKRIYRRWESGDGLAQESLRQTQEDLREAVKLTEGRPAERARVDRLRMYAHFLAIYLQPKRRPTAAEDAEAWKKQYGPEGARQRVQALGDWASRLIDTHMIHGYAFNKYLIERGKLLGCSTEGWMRPGRIPSAEEIESETQEKAVRGKR
jgi:hypothetical protein